jgi:DNA-binding NarL/FixJ family response regulator
MLADTTHGHFALICANASEYERCIEHMQLAGAPSFERFGEPGRRCLWSDALVRSTLALGRLDEAREWAARGEEFAGGLGLAQEAARELRVLGAAAPAAVPRRPGDSGTTALSRREQEVATLVTAGDSNPEIAQALYLSPKMIEGHMHRIFEKLGITSRAQLAATIARQESGRE